MPDKLNQQSNAPNAAADDSVNANWAILFACWLIACSATLGSLFFSEVMDFAPCSMCWYQRILMYPLVATLLVGMFPLDGRVVKYSLPFSIGGCAFAIYHTLIYAGYIPENLKPCSRGVSCSEKYIEVFGFLSIPAMSLLAFLAITAMLLYLRRRLPV